MNTFFLQSVYAGSCATCGSFLDIDNPRSFWIEKSCGNCGRIEGEIFSLSELIELAESKIEF